MAIKNGINQMAIFGGERLAPEINSVIPAITEEARNHRPAMGMYDDIKHLMERNLIGMPLNREVVGSIYLEGCSIPRSTTTNPTKSAEVLDQFVTTLQNAGIDAQNSIGGNNIAYVRLQVSKYQVCSRNYAVCNIGLGVVS
jgi:6-phosphofructokinase